MKQITEYLLGKGKAATSSFPEKPSTKDIISFLERHGFERGKDTTMSASSMSYEKENIQTPLYWVGRCDPYNDWSWLIVFGNPGEISEENPLFYCRTEGKLPNDKCGFIEYFGQIRKQKYFRDYESLRDRVIEYFDW